MPGWTHQRIAALESIPGCDPDEPTDWIPLRHELGVRAFGINAFRADHVGQIIVERHQETDHEEAYVVLDGAVDMTIDGDTRRVEAGEIVFVGEPGLMREGRAVKVPALVLAVGAQPGVAFAPSSWELRDLRKHKLL